MKIVAIAVFCIACFALASIGQDTQPLVAIHDSELTRALESIPASGATPAGPGTTGKQWWPTDWHYFVMPEAMKEALRSDGTAFAVVGDSNIVAGILVTNGVPKYPILVSLASEAIRDDEIAAFTNYVAAGGYLFIGSSAFTRNTNGTARSDFAFADEMGIHKVVSGLTNWAQNNYFTKTNQTGHRLISHIPNGQNTWRMPSSSEEIPWGISPSHPFLAPHDVWQIQAGDATVLAQGDTTPFLTIKPYGKGYFIYCSAFQPLIGHSGFAPSMYAYVIFRRAIEWAFESANLPLPKLSPWPYQYDAAFMIRHDLENFTNEIAAIEASAQVEFTNGAKGDYYFCTGTLRDDASPTYNTNNLVASLRRAVTNYGATIGPHNGGLRNPNNPSLVRGQYDYWHWGPDEALDVIPAGYSSGKAYASASISNSFKDVESWLSGITNGLRSWVACYFNGTREDSYDIQAQLGVKIAGDQKLTPFPHWTLSTLTSGKRYSFLTEPVSDWFVGGLVAQSLEPWHPPGVQNSQTLHAGIDFYYGLGALINFYSHSMSTGLGDAGALVPDYITYSLNTNLHPRVWSANGAIIYQWWLARSNAQVSVTTATNGYQTLTTFSIKGATDPNTSVELLIPGSNSMCSIQVITNGALASVSAYRTNGQLIKLRVGTSVTNAVISYFPISASQIFTENFDGVASPDLPSGWSTSSSGAQAPWATSASLRDTVPNSAVCIDGSNIGINELVSPPIALGPGTFQLSFRNNYDLETGAGTDGFDGGVLEIKIGTNAFTDILSTGGNFAAGGYTSTIDSAYGNPLAGRQAWSGTSAGFIGTVVNLPAAASGQTIQLRWRCGTDNGNARTGWRIDTIAINNRACLCCTVANTTPVLPIQPNRTIAELASLVVTNTATDPDVPANTLYYSLANAPAGASIDPNGVITWTPLEAQGPSTNTFTTIVIDSGFPPLSATNTFMVVVTEVNSAPVLPAQNNRTIAELTTLTVTNTATDSDSPANALSYSLLAAPAGATISSSGVIAWAPTEAQGPSTNTFTTVVTDNGVPSFSATNSFVVTVNEVNSAPILPPQVNRSITALTTLSVTNTAADSDIPANSLAYSLLAAPAGATISANGVITWTPSLAQDKSTNLLRTVVTDNGSPPLSATNAFTVFVNSDPVIVVDSTGLVVEGCSPTNNAIDAGETVTMLFSLKNAGLGNTTNLMVTLLETNGIVSPGGPQSFGVLLAGGTTVSQPFTFGSTGVCGGTITANLQLQDNSANLGTIAVSFQLGTMSTVLTQSFDLVTAPALPAGWTTTATGVQSNWTTQTAVRDTLPNAVFSPDANNVGLNELVAPPVALPAGPSQLIFKNNYDLEPGPGTNGYDGGVLEIKIGTNAFTDILAAGGSFGSGGYTRTISSSFNNPLGGRQAWSGNSGGFITTLVNLPASTENQTVQFRWRCGTDNGTGSGGWRIDSVGVAGYACCANSAPILGAQSDRTVAELATLIVTNTASDDPANTLTYVLVNAPAGAQIDANGVITWTPTEEQGPSTNIFTTIVTDNGLPPLTATNTFTVTVMELNSAPVLTVPADQTINELTILSVSASAIDPDLPANKLTFSLLSPPLGMTINAASGEINWTPTEAQGPSTNTITVVVTDDGSPLLGATNTFTVIVREVNVAPALPAQLDRTVNELSTLMVTNTATDPDIPVNSLTYSLLSPPDGAQIDTNGVITWTPNESQGPGTNTITVVVSDDGQPPLSTTNLFTVVVNEINSPPVLPVQIDRTIVGLANLIVTNSATDADLPANTLSYALVAGPLNALIDTNGVITWTPTVAQVPGTNVFTTVVTDLNPWAVNAQQLTATNTFIVVVNGFHHGPVLPAQTDRAIPPFTTLVVTNTAFDADIPACHLNYELVGAPTGAVIDSNGIITWAPGFQQTLVTRAFITVVTDDGTPPLSDTNSFTVTVNPPPSPPVILNLTLTNGLVKIQWSALAGHSYRLEYKDDFDDSNWTESGSAIVATQATATATDSVGALTQRFYRVVLLP